MRFMRYLLFLLLISFPFIAHAQDSGAIDKLCAHIENKQKPNSVEYVPGVDVKGNPVVPADLSDNGNSLINDPVILPININLAERYGLYLPTDIELEPNIANMVLFADGRIILGDKDLTPSIKRFCENYNLEATNNQSNQEEGHGHESANPVLSSDKIEGQYPKD